MGGLGGMFGLSGGSAGTGFAAPAQGVGVTSGTSAEQIAGAYGGAQNSLASQQALLAAIQSQNGLGNQSQVYNQLQGVANGTGPNPAQAQLAQATGQNTANQAALMAGQRGAGSNVGMIARQAGMQGAATQQNAAGQAATLQANQSLNALGAAGSMANTQAGNQIGATTANTQANLSEQQVLQNALAQQNNANVSMQSNINNANAGLANTQLQGQQQNVGGVMKGAAAAMAAHGGMITKYADGGVAAQTPNQINIGTPLGFSGNQGSQELGGGMSSLMSSLGGGSKSNPMETTASPGMGGSNGMSGSAASAAPVMVAAHGGNVGSKLKTGGGVPGSAPVSGDSYKNDTVKALLSPGEVVIPRSVMQSGDPINGAAKFIAAVLAKKGKK